jgi:hypothetical protein
VLLLRCAVAAPKRPNFMDGASFGWVGDQAKCA